MSTVLISDLHLDAAQPQTSEQFLAFLLGPARGAEQLFILGDLFEAWIGDDDPQPLAEQVASALRVLGSNGTRCAFMAGNRDFLLGLDYAARCNMTLLQEPLMLTLGGISTLLMHGDTLCTDDMDYQRFRSMVRNLDWQAQFLAQPLEQRQAFAARARAESTAHTRSSDAAIMDVNNAAVLSAMREHGVRRLIHGHTHRPAIHTVQLDGQALERIVLGDWHEQASYLLIEANGETCLHWAAQAMTSSLSLR